MNGTHTHTHTHTQPVVGEDEGEEDIATKFLETTQRLPKRSQTVKYGQVRHVLLIIATFERS